jgi:hypothetical protein
MVREDCATLPRDALGQRASACLPLVCRPKYTQRSHAQTSQRSARGPLRLRLAPTDRLGVIDGTSGPLVRFTQYETAKRIHRKNTSGRWAP